MVPRKQPPVNPIRVERIGAGRWMATSARFGVYAYTLPPPATASPATARPASAASPAGTSRQSARSWPASGANPNR